jgi:hypothetical protein
MTGRPADPHDERRVAPGALEFERGDVNPAVVAKWAIGLGMVSIVGAAVAFGLLVFLRKHEAASDPQRPALYFSSETRQPEGVRLQTTPFTDLHVLREQERQILATYGWVDEAAGVVHIPIAEAMRLYVERQAAAGAGVAASQAAAADARGPLTDVRTPTDSAPVPSPAAPVAAPPLPGALPSPVPSGPPAPPPPHGAGPAGEVR